MSLVADAKPEEPFVLLVTGSRYWTDPYSIELAMEKLTLHLPPDRKIQLVHCGCKGADTIAGKIAMKKKWLHPKIYYARSGTNGDNAGPIRNTLMVNDSKPHAALVCLRPDSVGTVDCQKKLEAYKGATGSRLKHLITLRSQ